MTFEVIAALSLVAFMAGVLDAIAGGGGLLTLPALLLGGLDPIAALATNKLQGTFSVSSSAWGFARRGYVHWATAWPMMLLSGTGAVLGALAVSVLPLQHIEAVLPVVLILIAVYFLFSPRLSDQDSAARLSAPSFTGGVVPAIGFYDGAFGPGTGSFFMLGFVALRGYGVLRATAHTKLLNLASNFGALLFFLAAGKPVWAVGLPMAAAGVVGGRVGSHLAIAGGARLIRPLLVVICVAMAVRLLANPAHPLRLMLGY